MTPTKGAAPASAATDGEGQGDTSKQNPFTPAPNQSQAISRRGGSSSRRKGNRAERAVVRCLQDRGFAAQRVPLSGAVGGRFSGDVTVPLLGRDRIVEVKVRARGFGQLYDWLNGRDLLIVRANRREPLVVLPLRLAADIAAAAERGKVLEP